MSVTIMQKKGLTLGVLQRFCSKMSVVVALYITAISAQLISDQLDLQLCMHCHACMHMAVMSVQYESISEVSMHKQWNPLGVGADFARPDGDG